MLITNNAWYNFHFSFFKILPGFLCKLIVAKFKELQFDLYLEWSRSNKPCLMREMSLYERWICSRIYIRFYLWSYTYINEYRYILVAKLTGPNKKSYVLQKHNSIKMLSVLDPCVIDVTESDSAFHTNLRIHNISSVLRSQGYAVASGSQFS